jgi:16S rRNA (cytidine1402-2'-O)-methyltransferase
MSLGTLFVVATPIGNLEDITLRAIRVLREAHLIAAEDTRRTARLLAHLAITTPVQSFHEHNAKQRVPQLLARLSAGAHVALVTDAGTPGVSDPGVELVAACLRAGLPVDPVPGVSAPLAAAIASGFPLIPLTIMGFPPRRSKARFDWIAGIRSITHTVTFFEAPHRIISTLRDAGDVLGDRQIMVGRELTKLHQECQFGTAHSLVTSLKELRGEFTVVVGPPDNSNINSDISVSDEAIADEFGRVTEIYGLTRRQAIADVAVRLGRPAREVYAAVERAKGHTTE